MGGSKDADYGVPTAPDHPPSDADPEARLCGSVPRRQRFPTALTPALSPRTWRAQVWDVVVVGAGVAGSALAFRLGNVRTLSSPRLGGALRATSRSRTRRQSRRRAGACCCLSAT